MMIAHIHLIVVQVLQQTFRIFKILLYLVFFNFVIALISSKAYAQEDYLAYYSDNKKNIFNNLDKLFILNDYVYSISIVESLDEVVVIDHLKSKSELLAISNIIKNYPKYIIEWPSSYSEKLINEIWKHYQNKNTRKIQIDNKEFINIDNGLISKKEGTSEYYFSVIVFQKSYLDSLFNINFNYVFNSLKK